jgi:hypothetical protein
MITGQNSNWDRTQGSQKSSHYAHARRLCQLLAAYYSLAQRAAKSLASSAAERCKKSGIIIFLRAETLIRVGQAANA